MAHKLILRVFKVIEIVTQSHYEGMSGIASAQDVIVKAPEVTVWATKIY